MTYFLQFFSILSAAPYIVYTSCRIASMLLASLRQSLNYKVAILVFSHANELAYIRSVMKSGFSLKLSV